MEFSHFILVDEAFELGLESSFSHPVISDVDDLCFARRRGRKGLQFIGFYVDFAAAETAGFFFHPRLDLEDGRFEFVG